MAKTAEERDPYAIECGKRLRLVRLAEGYTKRPGFARFTLDVADEEDLVRQVDNLRSWETGKSKVPEWYVEKLKRINGTTFDYIYGNDMTHLPRPLRERIIEAQRASPRKPRPSRAK